MTNRPQAKVSLQCTGCKQQRAITLKHFKKAQGKPFCPRCGNREVEIKAEAAKLR